jgi:uncharacterized protein (TIGR02588 family)
MAKQRARRSSGGKAERKARLEWVVAVLGAALVVAALGFMLFEALAGDDAPPDIAVRAGVVTPFAGGWLVGVEVENRGGETVARLRVIGELRDGERVVETSDAVIDYVPSRSNRGGGLFFRNDPRRFRLALRPVGFGDP